MNKRLRIAVGIFLACNFLMGFACGPTVDIKAKVDQATLEQLQKAIDAINAAPENFKSVLEETKLVIEGFGVEARGTAKEVERIYKDAVAATGVETRCTVDFVGKRAVKVLQDLKVKLNGGNVVAPPGWVCSFNPSEVEINCDHNGKNCTSNQGIINVFGFNFKSDKLPTIELRDSAGNTVSTTNIKLSFQTAYKIDLNMQAENFNGFQPDYYYRLKWDDGAEPNSVPIKINKSAPPTPTPTPRLPPSPIVIPPTTQPLKYQVTTYTNGIEGAGTDAEVFISIYGTKGSIVDKVIDSPGDSRERGMIDRVDIESSDIGDIESIVIRHDNQGKYPEWKLDKVTIRNSITGKEWQFTCNCWIPDSKGDKRLERRLVPNK